MSSIVALSLLVALTFVRPAESFFGSGQDKEVHINEGDRPEDRWRNFGGKCGENRYQVTIGSGKGLSQSVLDAKVDGVSYRSAVNQAMAQWASIEGLPMDVVIDRCEPGRARIAFHVLRPAEGTPLHFYYLWLGSGGDVELLGER